MKSSVYLGCVHTRKLYKMFEIKKKTDHIYMYIIITNYSYRAFSEKEKNIFTTWGIDSRFSDRKNFKIYSLPHGQCATNPCNFFLII